MTAQKIRTGGLLFEAQKNGDVTVAPTVTTPTAVAPGAAHRTVPHLDTIRLAYWLTKQYIKGAAKRTEGGR